MSELDELRAELDEMLSSDEPPEDVDEFQARFDELIHRIHDLAYADENALPDDIDGYDPLDHS